MAISKDTIENIRARCDIVELIGSFVQLRRAGTHTFKGLCPFHQEKTPSFHVDGARQWYHCFGCGKGGDVFRFLMEKENLSFIDAVQMLASRTGVVIVDDTGDPGESRRRTGEREKLISVNERFSEFFRRHLRAHPDSPAARYLAGRGIPPEVAEHFKIGAAPDDWTAGLEYGRACGFSDAEMIAAGVVRRKEDTGRVFDQFRGRLVFTIDNEYGRSVGFSARSLEAKPLDGRKYINTGETPVFHKGHLLYALPLARAEMGRRNLAVLCEGQLDTIAFHRSGIECAVAPLGTAFTPEQAKILKRCTNRIVLAFDADGAGRKAVLRAAEILLPLSVELKVMRLPGGKDPDELFRAGGAGALRRALDEAVPWLDVLMEAMAERCDLTTPVGRGSAAAMAADYLKLVSNRVELEVYVDLVARRLQVSPEAVYAELSEVRQTGLRRKSFVPAAVPVRPAAAGTDLSRPVRLALLELVLNSFDAAREVAEALPPEELAGRDPVTAAINLALALAVNGEHDQLPRQLADLLAEHPDPEISRLLVGHVDYRNHEQRAAADLIREFRRVELLRQQRELTAALRDPALSGDRRLELLGELRILTHKLKEIIK